MHPAFARMALRLREKRMLEGRRELPKPEPPNPYGEQQLEAKLMDLGAPAWGGDTTRAMLAGLSAVEAVPDFSAFADQYSL